MFTKIRSFFEDSFSYTLLLTAAICGFVIFERYFPPLKDFVATRWFPQLQNVEYLPSGSLPFVSNFIEWFGVLYGFLLPLMLVRVWQQFDQIDREFDREADTIRILYEDVLLFRKEDSLFKGKFLNSLLNYVNHVMENYQVEAVNESKARLDGDLFLRSVRNEFFELIHSDVMTAKESEILSSELLHQLNEVIDVRGDRIALSNQRLFESLQFVSLITSIIFVVPFYFVKFHQPPYGFLDSFLVFGVIFLVIFIMSTIEDLDEPFYGSWKIGLQSWNRLYTEMKDSIEGLAVPTTVNNEKTN